MRELANSQHVLCMVLQKLMDEILPMVVFGELAKKFSPGKISCYTVHLYMFVWT